MNSVLIGGGPGAVAAMHKHFRAIVGRLPKKPSIAYVGCASDDNAGFRKMIGGAFEKFGATVPPVLLCKKSDKVSTAKSVLDSADAIFVSGGDVAYGMKVLHDRGIDGHLVRLAKSGKLMTGLSAGSLMLAREWIEFADDHDTRGRLFPCLDIAPVYVDAHSEEDNWAELRALMRLRAERGDKAAVAIGLTKKGALEVRAGKRVTLAVHNGPLPRIAVKRGKVVDTKPLR